MYFRVKIITYHCPRNKKRQTFIKKVVLKFFRWFSQTSRAKYLWGIDLMIWKFMVDFFNHIFC